MKKLSLKNFFKYTLACLCAVCATIAGVFAIGTNTAKAETFTDFHMSSVDINFDGSDDNVAYASVYVPDTLLNLLNQDAEYTINNNYSIDTQIYVSSDDKLINVQKTAYVLVLREETDILTYQDENYDAYNRALNLYEDNVFIFKKHSDFLDGCYLDNIINGNQPNAINLDFIYPKNSYDYYFWADIVKVKYTQKVTTSNVVGSTDYKQQKVTGFYEEITSEVVYTTDNYKTKNINAEALTRLQNMGSSTKDAVVDQLLTIVGSNVSATDNITVNLTYKRVKDFAEVETITESFTILGRFIYNESYIKDYMYNVLGKSNISDFNAVYTDDYMIDGSIYDTQTRVFLQAESLSYSFDATSNVGTLNVNYAPFKYSNFVIRITNNDPTNNLTIDYFTADVVDNGTSTVLTFNFDTIERQLYNSALWLFDIQKDDFTINSASNITTSLSDTALTISFNNTYENNLSSLSVKLITEIMEDYELDVTYEYASLDDNLEETTITTEPVKMYYSRLVRFSNENFGTLEETEFVCASAMTAISPAVLNGQAYYTYDGITKDYNADKTACTVIVEYTYTTLLKVTDSLASKAVYVALNSNSLTYDYEDLPFNVPSGYRIKNVTSDGNVEISFSEHAPEDLIITINENTAQKKIITLTAELTDAWKVKVNYLERYKLTPFAVYKTVTKEVSVSEYGEIKNITADQTASIVGLSTLNVLKSAVESLDVTYDGTSTYTITPKYTYMSLKAIDYDGNSKEVKVPLTCYEDYCDMFGQDWSILWLNTSKTEYFEYSNSVARDKLYGYFNVAVFEEQVSDLNYYFQQNTGDGCMTIFKSQQVVGSKVYRFASNMRESLMFGGVGYGLMAFCEIANDNNKILETYFFYLDSTSDKPFISNGGADDSEDDDSAGENLGEDVVDKVEDGINKVEDKLNEAGDSIADWFENNPFAQFLKLLGYVLVGGLALFIIVFIFRKIK